MEPNYTQASLSPQSQTDSFVAPYHENIRPKRGCWTARKSNRISFHQKAGLIDQYKNGIKSIKEVLIDNQSKF